MTASDLSCCRLYGIVDLSYVDRSDAASIAERMVDGGVDLIQLRAKSLSRSEIETVAADLHRLTTKRNVPFIVNDYPEIARAVSAEGIHLGQDDVSIDIARNMAGPNCMIGKSTHSVDQAIRAFYEGADYVGFGPIFATPTKPDYRPIGLNQISRVHQSIPIPIFCIGGIKVENLAEVIGAGAQRVVIVSGLLQANDVASYARAAKKLLSETKI